MNDSSYIQLNSAHVIQLVNEQINRLPKWEAEDWTRSLDKCYERYVERQTEVTLFRTLFGFPEVASRETIVELLNQFMEEVRADVNLSAIRKRGDAFDKYLFFGLQYDVRSISRHYAQIRSVLDKLKSFAETGRDASTTVYLSSDHYEILTRRP